MVGVSGRSKACRTCKARRKGCDYHRPHCMRCVRGGFECRGYDDETHVVVYQPDRSTSEQTIVPFDEAGPTPLKVLPFALQGSAIKSAYFSAAWSTLHPTHGDAFWYPWIMDLSAVHTRESPLHAAFTAVALARAGQDSRDMVLNQQSQNAYFRAVQRINKQLRGQRQVSAAETITACLTLSIYEAVHGSSKYRISPMLAHVTGSREIARAQGPRAFKTPLGQAMLRDLRQPAIMESFGARKPSFFTGKAWSEALTSRTVKDVLIDIMASLPPLMEHYDNTKATQRDHPAASAIEAVHQQVRELIRDLEVWHEENLKPDTYIYAPSSSLSEARLRELELEHLDLCRQKRKYVSVVYAEMHILYATTQLMLYLEVLDIARFVSSAFKEDAVICEDCASFPSGETICMMSIDQASAVQKAQGFAHIIVQSLEHHFESQSGVLAASSTVFPLVAAVAFLRRLYDPAARYALALVEAYQRRTGARVADMAMECLGIVVEDESELPRWLAVDRILKESLST